MEQPSKPLLSVIVPVHNGERFVREALLSILAGGHEPLEILVVDDGSTDGTKGQVEAAGGPVTYHYQKNQGPAAARNSGIQKARGEYLAFLDCDDLWTAGRLETMFRKFKEKPDLLIVLGHVRSEALPGCGKVPKNLMRPQILPLFGAGLFKREVFSKIGLMDPSLRFSEDQDWFLRVKESGIPMSIVKEVVLIRRIHTQNMTRGMTWEKAGILQVMRKSINRRKKQHPGAAPDLPKLSDYKEG